MHDQCLRTALFLLSWYPTVTCLFSADSKSKKETPLANAAFWAARKGNLALLQLLLNSGRVDVDCKDSVCAQCTYTHSTDFASLSIARCAEGLGTTALMVASYYGHIDCVRELVLQGADINLQRESGATSLFFAAQQGHNDVVKFLFEFGASTEFKNKDGGTALLAACQYGHAKVVETLLKHGANIHDQLYENAAFTESQNRIGWKRPLRSSSPTVNLTLPRPPLNHVPKHLIPTSFKYLQGWRLHHFPGQPGPMLDNPFSEEKFPNIQSKPPLVQLEAISSHPIICYLGEETNPHLATPSFQAKQPQLPQPLPISLVLQTLHQLRCPSLDTPQHLNVPLVVRGPKLNTAFESLPTLKQINTLTKLGVICKLTEGALDPLVQIIDKDIKQNWSQHRALGDTACDRPPTGFNSIHHHSLGPAIQPVLYPVKSTPVQAMSSQFLQENADGASAIFLAAQGGYLDVIRLLLSSGAKVNQPRQDGTAPLWIASQMGHSEVVRVMLLRGAERDAARDDGTTALLKAAIKGYNNVIEELLKFSPTLGLLKNGTSALHAAVLSGNARTVALLLEAGADPCLRNKANELPAELTKNERILRLLRTKEKQRKS
ncbi:hypothetical protein QYF61_022268 [Mycteria americana]|uniref:Ankyrin repeat domain-containing protein 29 n=1 Tax=Mycteria americana TaxID=33587 RepID=A0AAN7NP26_MYCAM|nr:hypothetical protein QYF61_022268 [Mycteria americana]